MKNILLFLALMMLFIMDGYSQASFNTGTMEVAVNEYGRIRLFDSEGIRHLQRASILVGTSPTAVFDYTNDAEQLEPTVLVEPALLSDFEIYGAYDNSYSAEPPDVIVKLNAYGWTNGSYLIVKFTVKNDEANAMNAIVGLDIIPELNQEYGFDTVTYNGFQGVIRFHRGDDMNMGIKLLSASLFSLYSFEWYEDYSVDADYWTWMNYGSLQSQYVSTTADGPVTITSQDPVSLAPGESVEVFYALALGTTQMAMQSNIAAAVEKYQSWFISVDDKDVSPIQFHLGQNWPNPFHHSTTISYELPNNGLVSLKVYNAIGQQVATLVNSEQTAGAYTVQFDASGLTGGMYYYTLSCNDRVQSNKMFVIK